VGWRESRLEDVVKLSTMDPQTLQVIGRFVIMRAAGFRNKDCEHLEVLVTL
jgi:hypothetical protein